MVTIFRAETIRSPYDTIYIAILVPQFNIFNTIHFKEETMQTIEERHNSGKTHLTILIQLQNAIR